jgi:hypothetical protein
LSIVQATHRCPFVFEDTFTDAEKEAFKHQDYYKTFRHELESDLNVSHSKFIVFSIIQWQFEAVCALGRYQGKCNATERSQRVQGEHVEQISEEAVDRQSLFVISLILMSYQ